jgi:Domain of unknown function (DUF4461)
MKYISFIDKHNQMMLPGHLILNSEEVRHNWLEMIRNVDHYEVPLKRVPPLEAAMSLSLSDTQVPHRRFRPELLAENYESQLRKEALRNVYLALRYKSMLRVASSPLLTSLI